MSATTTDRTMRTRVLITFAALSAAGLVAASATAQTAQPTPRSGASTPARPGPAQAVRRGKAYRPPLVDLEKQALGRRPGQVLPGDPPPERFSAPVETPAPQTPAPGASSPAAAPPSTPTAPVSLPASTGETAPGRPIKPAPTPVDPESGPRSLPRSLKETPPRTAAASPAPEPLDQGVTPVPGSQTTAVDTGDGGSVSTVTAAAAAVKPARAEPEAIVVRVVGTGPNSGAEWREIDGAWGAIPPSASQTARTEIRTGLDGDVRVELDGRVEVRIRHLSRVLLERRSGDSPMPMITVERGEVELRAIASEPVESWIRTPDRSAGFASLPGVRITYSAFKGTVLDAPAPR